MKTLYTFKITFKDAARTLIISNIANDRLEAVMNICDSLSTDALMSRETFDILTEVVLEGETA